MGPLAIAALAAPVVGGLIGQSASSADAARSRQMYEKALAEYAGISLPDIEKMQLSLDELQSVGALNPSMETALDLGPSEFEGIALNPEVRAKQMDALQMFADRAVQGYAPEDRAMFELNRRNVANDVEAKQQQILQNMQSRGMGGSGNELISRLLNAQEGADRMSQAGQQNIVNSQAAKMQAARDLANTGNQIRGQDFSQNSKIAEAKDLVKRINQQNSQQVQRNNVNANNQAQQFNLQNSQRISDSNVGLRNQAQINNKNLYQTNFNNQMTKANAMSGQMNNLGQNYANSAANTQAMWSRIGKSIGGGMAGYDQMQNE